MFFEFLSIKTPRKHRGVVASAESYSMMKPLFVSLATLPSLKVILSLTVAPG